MPHPYSQAVETLELVGRRWNAAILLQLHGGPRRFSALSAGIEQLTDRVLATRLRELEAAGLVTRTVSTLRPVQVTYELTVSGRDLENTIAEAGRWAGRWMPRE